jgi:hypothetical protein
MNDVPVRVTYEKIKNEKKRGTQGGTAHNAHIYFTRCAMRDKGGKHRNLFFPSFFLIRNVAHIVYRLFDLPLLGYTSLIIDNI